MAAHAYRRRRAWGPWHTAFLSTHSYKDGFPSLASLAGEAEPETASPHRDAVNLHNLRLWKAALKPKD